MKNVYSAKAVVCAMLLSASTTLFAQHATTVTPSDQCNIVQDFDTSSGGFHSPSIYTESDYTEFTYDATNGYWIENSGITMRNGSLVSPCFINQQADGAIDIGFDYQACMGTEYRIRIINQSCVCPSGYDIAATTAVGPQWTPFPDPAGHLCLHLADLDLRQGQQFRVEISYRNGTMCSSCPWVFDNLSLGGDQAPITLPVTFMGITATLEKSNLVNLTWDVADEINVVGYEVERSSDGNSYSKVGYVPATKKSTYNLKDNVSTEGTIYYRVKNIDIDGRFKYSNVVRLKNKQSTIVAKATPTPAHSQVTLEHSKVSSEGVISLRTLDGRTVKQIRPAANAIQTQVDLSSITPGMYIISIDDGYGNTENIKIIKQ